MEAWEVYGTIFRMTPIPGKEQEVYAIFEEWGKDLQSNIEGAVAGYVMRPDTYTGVLIAVAMFESKESYESNGKDPAQGEWFAKLRAVLQSDPDWEDGEYMVVR
jgi:quinol monooxygenase YgiN